MNRSYYIYIVTNPSRTVLYTGMTNNLKRRIWEHRTKVAVGFTSRYNIYQLMHYETFGEVTAAIKREKEIKGWSRMKKNALIDKSNPLWIDLYDGLFF